MISVYPCGTKVNLVMGNIQAMITGVSIRFDKVNYEVSYFNGLEQKCIWVYEQEFTTDVKTKNVGYK